MVDNADPYIVHDIDKYLLAQYLSSNCIDYLCRCNPQLSSRVQYITDNCIYAQVVKTQFALDQRRIQTILTNVYADWFNSRDCCQPRISSDGTEPDELFETSCRFSVQFSQHVHKIEREPGHSQSCAVVRTFECAL